MMLKALTTCWKLERIISFKQSSATKRNHQPIKMSLNYGDEFLNLLPYGSPIRTQLEPIPEAPTESSSITGGWIMLLKGLFITLQQLQILR